MRRLGARILAAGMGWALFGPGLAVAQPLEPVKVGMLVPLTGVFARNGREAVDGARLYLDEIGWKAHGRTIELLVEPLAGTARPLAA